VPPYPYHLLTALISEHHREVYATDPRATRRNRPSTEPGGARPRPLLVRLLNRVVGPR
jgi:hypothetical protein